MWSRHIIKIALLAFVVVVVSIAVWRRPDPPPPIALPRVLGAAYQLSVTRYSGGDGLICQPFKVEATYDRQSDFRRHVLFAEQADDVTIAQTPSAFIVFYRDLSLTSFSDFSYAERDAKALLCDIDVPLCAVERERLIEAGTKILRLCGSVRS
jgi:hypothetical protein